MYFDTGKVVINAQDNTQWRDRLLNRIIPQIQQSECDSRYQKEEEGKKQRKTKKKKRDTYI